MKRPWNIVDLPVYSLATFHEGRVNMNICTYVTAVSMKPKLYLAAIDYTTYTYDRLNEGCSAILQILHRRHLDQVSLLGQKSGKTMDKQARLEAGGLITTWNSHPVLKDACGYLQLRQTGRQHIGGDHELFFFAVEKSKTISEDHILMFQDLINAGIIL